MINGEITEHGTGKTYQRGLYFIEERKTSCAGDRVPRREVWGVSGSGISLCSAGQRAQRKDGRTGSFCGVYHQNASQPYHQDKKVCKFQRNFHQQSSQSSAGRFFSKERSCQKKRDKLKYHFPTIVCGSKSSLRFTIFSFQSIMKLFPLNNPLMN